MELFDRDQHALTRRLWPGHTLDGCLCEGFQTPAHDDGCEGHRGRCRKACREGTRERCAVPSPRALWGFGRGCSCGGDGIEVWVLLIVAVGERN
jgi:hypothetical protein